MYNAPKVVALAVGLTIVGCSPLRATAGLLEILCPYAGVRRGKSGINFGARFQTRSRRRPERLSRLLEAP
jgi:hypothetical protein